MPVPCSSEVKDGKDEKGFRFPRPMPSTIIEQWQRSCHHNSLHQPSVAILAQAQLGGCPIGPCDTFFRAWIWNASQTSQHDSGTARNTSKQLHTTPQQTQNISKRLKKNSEQLKTTPPKMPGGIGWGSGLGGDMAGWAERIGWVGCWVGIGGGRRDHDVHLTFEGTDRGIHSMMQNL